MIALALFVAAAQGQPVAARVDAVRDGVVLMHYTPRAGVCSSYDGSFYTSGVTSRGQCEVGPAWVWMARSGGETINLHMRVGRRPPTADGEVDLGEVDADDAARYLTTAARTLSTSNAERALTAASIADVVNVGELFLPLVRDAGVRTDTRKSALFWAGQSDLPAARLVGVWSDLTSRELRKHFTFVLSQRRESAATEKLMDIARHDADREVRKQALFWLGQIDDPRARDFLRTLILSDPDE